MVSNDWHPEVYAPSSFSKERRKEWAEIRDEIIKRDNRICQACQKRKKKSTLTAHHVLPRDQGGLDDPANLLTICPPCHDYVEAKGFRTWGEIIGCTKDIDWDDPEVIQSVDAVRSEPAEIKKPLFLSREPKEDPGKVAIVCPNCDIRFIRNKNSVGRSLKKIRCFCGWQAWYFSSQWNWYSPAQVLEQMPISDINKKVKAARDARMKPIAVKQPKEKKVKAIDPRFEIVRCPVCQKEYHRDRQYRYNINCDCGCKGSYYGLRQKWIWKLSFGDKKRKDRKPAINRTTRALCNYMESELGWEYGWQNRHECNVCHKNGETWGMYSPDGEFHHEWCATETEVGERAWKVVMKILTQKRREQGLE